MPSEAFQNMKKSGQVFMPPHDLTSEEGLAQLRSDLALNSLPNGILPSGVSVRHEKINGVPCDWVLVNGAPSEKLMIHVHGGGFCGGITCTQQYAMIRVAQLANVNILSIDYRLAPEHPYPAAVEDCMAVYKGMLQMGFSSSDMVFIGESAGGTLSLVMGLYARDHGMPLPAAIVAVSPCGDTSLRAVDRKDADPHDPLLIETDGMLEAYLRDADDPEAPYASPIYADYSGMPPIFIQAGTNEMLASDPGFIWQKAVKANVDIHVHSWAHMEHVFFLQYGLFPEAGEAVKELAEYVSEKIKTANYQ